MSDQPELSPETPDSGTELPRRRKTDGPWWRDHRAVMEIVALVAISAAILVSLFRGKVDLEPAVLMLTGSIATVSMAVKRRGT